MAFHGEYFSCSKFADWIRGTAKPTASDSAGWRDWTRKAKESHPIRYWIAEVLLDKVQDTLTYPTDRINSFRYYLNNRFVDRTNALVAHPRDIKPGAYSELGSQIIPCLFNGLVDFVEINLAWIHLAFQDEEVRAKYNLPWWRKRWWTRWFMRWRSAEAGLAHLDWASTLTFQEDSGVDPTHKLYGQLTPQAIAAKEMKELYIWWTVDRPKRQDPHDASGWGALCDARHREQPDMLMFEDKTPEQELETVSTLAKLQDIEERYEEEDTRMLIRLIKIRQSLWT